MLPHTKAYQLWRTNSQQMLDFSVLVCTAVPNLEALLAARTANPNVQIVRNARFRPSRNPYVTEGRAAARYEEVLGATLMLSLFAYFEAYFFDLIDELIEFHGGENGIEDNMNRALQPIVKTSLLAKAVGFLGTVFKPEHSERYRKYSRQIRGEGFVWPSQRFMLYGLKQAMRDKKRWKAFAIPDLAVEILTFPMSSADREGYEILRDNRNKIAHGEISEFELERALEASRFFVDLAKRIDRHAVENCFIIEKFAH